MRFESKRIAAIVLPGDVEIGNVGHHRAAFGRDASSCTLNDTRRQMLDTVTVETFTPHIGETFFLHVADAAPVAVSLIEAEAQHTESDPRRKRVPFSLLFRGPKGTAFAQGTYRIEREGLEALDLFLVPIVPDQEGPRLQAIFS